jgi:hypothetical protein
MILLVLKSDRPRGKSYNKKVFVSTRDPIRNVT